VNVPLVFVPGNHDPDLKAKPQALSSQDFQRPLSLATLRREPPGPMGCSNADGRVVREAGMRIAGLGGSVRYKPGPNQYTQRQMTRRALRLEMSSACRRARPDGKIDILITHSPPWGIGDGDDPAHRGFIAFRRLVTRFSPKLLIHGHVHPYGRVIPTHRLGSTTIVNVVGHRMLKL
ncbi:MAG: metallophosphoesterase, partial [Actinobacteria bacterium]|nr:metallophosphoesterase [Actinomycetota bacterium]